MVMKQDRCAYLRGGRTIVHLKQKREQVIAEALEQDRVLTQELEALAGRGRLRACMAQQCRSVAQMAMSS